MTKEEVLSYLKKAEEARKNAQAMYSNFQVGCLILLENGEEYWGANVESSSYGLSICAERVALANALTASKSKIKYIFVIADCEVPVPPCGACRQLLYDYASDATVVYANLQYKYKETTIKELLPDAFHSALIKR